MTAVATPLPPNYGCPDFPTPVQSHPTARTLGTVFVGGISDSVDEKMLSEFFADLSYQIKSAKIMVDDNKRSRGYGFVEFVDDAQAQDCLKKYQNKTDLKLMEKVLNVNAAFKKKDHKSGSPGMNNGEPQTMPSYPTYAYYALPPSPTTPMFVDGAGNFMPYPSLAPYYVIPSPGCPFPLNSSPPALAHAKPPMSPVQTSDSSHVVNNGCGQQQAFFPQGFVPPPQIMPPFEHGAGMMNPTGTPPYFSPEPMGMAHMPQMIHALPPQPDYSEIEGMMKDLHFHQQQQQSQQQFQHQHLQQQQQQLGQRNSSQQGFPSPTEMMQSKSEHTIGPLIQGPSLTMSSGSMGGKMPFGTSSLPPLPQQQQQPGSMNSPQSAARYNKKPNLGRFPGANARNVPQDYHPRGPPHSRPSLH